MMENYSRKSTTAYEEVKSAYVMMADAAIQVLAKEETLKPELFA